jgi:Tn3 transposase DDE domain
MLALHLLQSALVHVNALILQRVLAEPAWRERLSDVDQRALTPLFWSNVNPYGRFRPDMNATWILRCRQRDCQAGRRSQWTSLSRDQRLRCRSPRTCDSTRSQGDPSACIPIGGPAAG